MLQINIRSCYICQIHRFGILLIHFAKHALYKLELIQMDVSFLHLGIKYCQNWSVYKTGGGIS